MKYRVKFSKNGPIKYIGHLDVMRYFQKAIRRAQLPIKYSEGFSPHQILSFAFPLSVGYTSSGEYFDMEMTEQVNETEMMEALNSVMNEGILVENVKQLPEKSGNCMALVFAAKYTVKFKSNIELPVNFCKSTVDFFSQSTIPVNKTQKKGGKTVEIDLKEFLYDYQITDNCEVSFTVNASSSDNIRPSFVIDCLLNYINFNVAEHSYYVHRDEIYANLSSDGIDLISLLEV